MYTKEEREGILWEFHRSGLSAPAACRSLPLFPNKDNLYAWLKLEEAGELTAREMPDRAERMHCSHGEGSPAFAARRPGTEPASPRKRRAEGGAGKMERTGRGGASRRPRVSVNIIFTISTNAFSPIAPTRIRRIRQRGCAAFGA